MMDHKVHHSAKTAPQLRPKPYNLKVVGIMNRASNIINLFSDFYYVSDIEFTKIQGEQLGRLIIVVPAKIGN